MTKSTHSSKKIAASPRQTRGAASAIANDPGVYARAAADPEKFWADFAGELEWITPWSRVLEWKSPHAKWFVGGKLNASVNCLDRHVRGPRRNKAAFIWEGEPGDRRTLTYWDLYRQVERVRQRAQVARREDGRSRRALHAADSRAGDRDARVRAHRRGAQRGLRRLQRRVAARSHQRLAVRRARDRRRRLPPRPDRAAEADGRRGADRHAVDQARRRRPASGRRADPGAHAGGARPLVPPPDAGRGRLLRARGDGRGGHALHPLHLRHDREAEGHRPHDRRLPDRHVRDDEVGLRSARKTTSTGAPPTSAG